MDDKSLIGLYNKEVERLRRILDQYPKDMRDKLINTLGINNSKLNISKDEL